MRTRLSSWVVAACAAGSGSPLVAGILDVVLLDGFERGATCRWSATLSPTIPGGCRIDDIYWCDDDPNPAAECEVCDSAVSTTFWSPAPNGTLCGGLSCEDAAEYQSTCSAGACEGLQFVRDCTTTVDTRRCGATACAGVVEVTASGTRTYPEMSDGSIWAWGDNWKGVLGPVAPDGDVVRTPTRLPDLVGVKKLTSSPYAKHQCALLDDGRLLCWGDNHDSQLGRGPLDNLSHPLPMAPLLEDFSDLIGVVDASAGTFHTCAIRADNSVTCWGRGDQGQLGDGLTGPHWEAYAGGVVLPSPATTGWRVHTGERHNCIAVDADSTSRSKCWGTNSFGESGLDPESQQDTGGVAVETPMDDLDATLPRGLALGSEFTCGVIDGGFASCFGSNLEFQLGRGVNGVSYTHVPGPVCATSTPDCNFSGTGTPLADVTMVTLGEAHACALAAGEVRCWGNNDYGELGTGSGAVGINASDASGGPTFAPVQTPVQQISSGWNHSCALLADRTVACWGRNQEGKIGIPSEDLHIPSPAFPIW